jgi:hypothetical protein
VIHRQQSDLINPILFQNKESSVITKLIWSPCCVHVSV